MQEEEAQSRTVKFAEEFAAEMTAWGLTPDQRRECLLTLGTAAIRIAVVTSTPAVW